MTMETEPRRRRGGARGNPQAGNGGTLPQLPKRQVKRHFPPTKIISDDEIESIHLASLRVLQEIGMDFLHDEARAMWKKAGADVQGERIRFDPALIESLVAHAPEQFKFHGRNPENVCEIGGDNMLFSPVGSPPNCHDMDGGRRIGTRVDYQNFLRLAQHFNVFGCIGGYPVEPVDIHASIRHLDALYDKSTLTDKPFNIYVLGLERTLDGIEIARLARGISAEQMLREPSVGTIVNTNSPLKLDFNMLTGIIEMSSRGQMVCVTPFTLAGAMAPVTVKTNTHIKMFTLQFIFFIRKSVLII